jgi:hypothetical protein
VIDLEQLQRSCRTQALARNRPELIASSLEAATVMNDFLEIDGFHARPNRVVGRCRQTCFLAFTRNHSVQCGYAGPLWSKKECLYSLCHDLFRPLTEDPRA